MKMGRFLQDKASPGPGDYETSAHLTMQEKLQKKMTQLVKSSSARGNIVNAKSFGLNQGNSPGPADYETNIHALKKVIGPMYFPKVIL